MTAAANMAPARPMSKKAAKAAELAETQAHVRTMLTGVDRVAISCVQWSRSGMQRRYRVLVACPDGRIYSPTGAIGHALGYRVADDGTGRCTIVLGGCGFSGEDEIAGELGQLLGRRIAYDEI